MSSRGRYGRTPLAVRFLVTYALAYAVLIGLMGFVVIRTVQSTLLSELNANLETSAELAQQSLPDSPDELADWSADVFSASGYRTTLITVDGVVLADSHSDPSVMENHSDREEVIEATAGEVGSAIRVSASTGFEQLYVALPSQDELIVRLSVPTREIEQELGAVRSSIIWVSVVMGLLGVVVVAFVARRTAKPITELIDQSGDLAGGDLTVTPRRSPVRELDSLGVAISALAEDLGTRVTEAERAFGYLETVLGALPQGTVLFNGTGEVVYANPSAHELLGAIPTDLSSFSPFAFQTAVREAKKGLVVTREAEYGAPRRRLRGVASPFTDDDRILLIVVDITESERAAEVRRDFVANASHELKTPVSSIVASADALRIAVERGDESAIRFADQIQLSARQLNSMVGDLLDLSRLERDQPDLAPVRLDLLVGDEIERVRSTAEENGVVVNAQLNELTVLGSHRDLAVAMRNLLDNAVHYTDTGGSVEVTLDREDVSAVIEVRDTGVGIPIRDSERVFERFYRVDTARSRATGGTGLGLSIVKHVAESHGGSVRVESELGAGSTFTLSLPFQAS